MSTIRYSVSGLREGPALLLLHAMGANRHMWDECATLWSPQFAVVACDLRGAGESPPPDRPWTPEDHANDVEAVRAELGLDQIITVGCAIGAVVAHVVRTSPSAACASARALGAHVGYRRIRACG